MAPELEKPIIYLITSGATTAATTAASEEFSNLLWLVKAAVTAKVTLIQIREKSLTARVLFELTELAAELTRGSQTQLLVNDRPDIARAAGADGVHLSTTSVPAPVIRRTFGSKFLVGVSTHSLEELEQASQEGADFAVFGPVFSTESKRRFGPPVGLKLMAEAAKAVAPWPVLALGGITVQNAYECFRAGASGVAAIRMLSDPTGLAATVGKLREIYENLGKSSKPNER